MTLYSLIYNYIHNKLVNNCFKFQFCPCNIDTIFDTFTVESLVRHGVAKNGVKYYRVEMKNAADDKFYIMVFEGSLSLPFGGASPHKEYKSALH